MSQCTVQPETHCQRVSTHGFDWQSFQQFPTKNFMQEPAWMKQAWECYYSRQCGIGLRDLFILRVVDDQGIALGQSAWIKQFYRGLNRWRIVGSGAICGDYLSLHHSGGHDSEAAKATARWFLEQPRKLLEAPQAIEVEGHAENDPAWQTFFDTCVDGGWTCDSVAIESAWRIRLEDSTKVYEKRLSKSRRRKFRLALKLRQAGQIQLNLHNTPASLQDHWTDFVRLHQMRRQQLGQPGLFVNPNYEQFLFHSALQLSEQGKAMLVELVHQSQPLAMLLLFTNGTTWSIYQSGFDTSRIDLQPGHMVNALMIDTALERGIAEVDFLRGDENYKKGWGATPSPLYRTILLPPGLASRGISTAIKLRRSFKSWFSKSQRESGDCEGSDSTDADIG